MKEKFQQLLENIKKDLIFLANKVEHNIRQAVKALEAQDVKLADQVASLDTEVDMMEVRIEDQILTLLALQQPVAIDLRFIVGGLKMNNDLERIGDHAVNIAATVPRMADKPVMDIISKIHEMNELSCKMLHDVVSAFIHQDAELARVVCAMDNEVDDFYENIVEEILKIIKEDVTKLEQGYALIRVARFLERVGDLATNIAEDVVFMKEAKIIRHNKAEYEAS